MKKFSDFVIEQRVVILIITFLLTCFFAYHLRDLKVYTKFADLLPQGHEYIKLHNRIRAKFGGANTVVMILQVREGDIFNPNTLQKLKDITEELHYIPAVDRFKIISISLKKMKSFVLKSGIIEAEPLMWPDVPETQEEIEELKEKVYGSFFYGGFVWFDSKKTFITADFFEDEIDYSVVYEALLKIQEKYEDDNNILSISGEPLRLGYVKSYVGVVIKIMIITLGVMMLFFLFYFRSIRGMLIPILAALVGGVWGMGFMALLGYNLDPLVLVFPFLIAARTAGHAVQVIKRYIEECGECNDNKEACKRTIRYLFRPGFTGIITDAAGIMLIALTPLKILQKITFTCAFWSVATVVIALLLVPCILACFPFPHKSVERLKKKGLLDKGLAVIGGWIPQRGYRVVLLCFAVLLAGGAYLARDIQVGDAIPGSSLLWPWHRYNQDSFRIAFSMPVLSPLYVIMEGEEKDDLISCPDKPRRKCGDNLREMRRFERFMRKTPGRLVMFTRSIVGTMGGGASFAHEGDPNWSFFPPTDKRLITAYVGAKYRGEPGSMDMFIDEYDRSSNIIIYCRDKMTSTINTVMARIKEYTDLHAKLGPSVKYKLAGGAFGVQAAINEVIEKYQVRTLACTLLAIFLFCTVLFRSIMAGIILTIPLIVSNVIAFALMATGFLYALPMPITLTTSTLPVSAVGIGLGVDYGIYLLSRIMEEHKISHNLNDAITAAMTTTGKAVIYISTTLTIGILFWVFSPLMFQATMGFFLAIILFFNMIGALFLVTSLVAVLKPKFITG